MITSYRQACIATPSFKFTEFQVQLQIRIDHPSTPADETDICQYSFVRRSGDETVELRFSVINGALHQNGSAEFYIKHFWGMIRLTKNARRQVSAMLPFPSTKARRRT